MDQYLTGNAIKAARTARGITQQALACKLGVSDKSVSKWETGRGYPDITLLEPLAKALNMSTIELLSGSSVSNDNRAANLKRLRFYVCPVCGNVITSLGSAVVSCCGLTLPELQAEQPDGEHAPRVETSEDEYYVSLPHEMTREHFISWIACLRDNRLELEKLYPEGNAECRFKIRSVQALFWYCNRHGLFTMKPERKQK